MIQLHLDSDLARNAHEHLARGMDRLGFFLADVDEGVFTLHAWWPIADNAIEHTPSGHVQLTDAAAVAVIRWARENEASLVEVHSHGQFSPAAFSRFDVAGFTEWVPGVRWRLRGAPYAAAVIAADTVDAWAWVCPTSGPAQVDAVVVGTDIIPTTGATLERLNAQLRVQPVQPK